MRSVERVVGTYSRNQNQFISHFTTLCFWRSVNRLGCYRRAWYRRKVFALGTPLNNSQKNGETVKDTDNKCHDLLLQEHCKKLFLLMGSFWDEIKDFEF